MSKRLNGGKAFWKHNGKHSAIWAGVAALAVAACKVVVNGDWSDLLQDLDHFPQVAGIVGLLRVVIGQFGGNVGDPETSTPNPNTK